MTGGGPGGIVIGGGTTTTGVAAITSAGPNNAANVWNRRNLFTISDGLQINKGIHQFSAGFWFQRVQDNENTASRRLGQASFASLQTFLQGTATSFQVVPSPTELGWRSVFGAWYVEDTIRLRPNLTLQLGLRHEFTNGWNEVAGRAANYVTDRGPVADRTRGRDFRVHREQCEEAVRSAGGAGLGCFRQWQDCRSRGLRDVLFAYRRSQLSVEFSASV